MREIQKPPEVSPQKKREEKIGHKSFSHKETSEKVKLTFMKRNAEDEKEIWVYHLKNVKGKEKKIYVGTISFNAFCGRYWLTTIAIEHAYREMGVAKFLVLLARDYLGDWEVACMEYYYSDMGLTGEGVGFLAYCLDSGVLKVDRFVLPEDLPPKVVIENSSMSPSYEERSQTGSYEERFAKGKQPAKLLVEKVRGKLARRARENSLANQKSTLLAKRKRNSALDINTRDCDSKKQKPKPKPRSSSF